MRIIRGNTTIFTPSRSLEWHCALSALAFAIVLGLPGNTFEVGPQWDRFAAVMSEQGWAMTVAGVAFLRISALLINGHARRTPVLRAITAVIGTGLWAYVAYLFWIPGQPMSVLAGISIVLAGSDAYSTFRAGIDAATSDWIWEKMEQNPSAPMPWKAAP